MTGFAERLRLLGPFNFVYTDGDTLFVHSHRRTQCDGEIRPPGLHLLVRSCNEQAIDLSQSGIMMAPIAQELTLFASVPLTDEPWEPIAEGEVIAVKEGLVWMREAVSSTPRAFARRSTGCAGLGRRDVNRVTLCRIGGHCLVEFR